MAEFTGFNEVICHRWIDEVRGLRCCMAQGHPGSCSAVHPQRATTQPPPFAASGGRPSFRAAGDLT